MFKILIADDEKFIRKGILSILERNFEQPLNIIEAKNGIDALEKMEKETPDLIITDISMPGCNGLEFVKKLKERNINTTVIILTGYENFEYAKKAITLGIKEYIIKPIKKNEFIDLIKRYITDIQQQQLKSQEEIERKIENNRIVEGVKKDFLVGLLKCSNNREASQYMHQLKGLRVNLETQLCTCVVFQFEMNPENQEYMDFLVKNILDEYLNLESEDFVLNVNFEVGKVISIFKNSSTSFDYEERKKIIRTAARLIREYGQVRVFAGVGDMALDFEHLNGVLRHALQAVDFKIFDRGDILCFYDEIEAGQKIESDKRTDLGNILDISTELNRIYAAGQTQAVMDAMRTQYDEVVKYIKSRLVGKTAGQDRLAPVCKEFSMCWSLDEMKRELKQGLDKLVNLNESVVVNTQLMERIIEYVDENITKELDLNIIADKFCRSPGYISTMFKQYEEEGFNTYITEKRIVIAKKLLKDRSIPIRKVAEACGYYNAKYFSVVFKKQVGQTPREYRDKIV